MGFIDGSFKSISDIFKSCSSSSRKDILEVAAFNFYKILAVIMALLKGCTWSLPAKIGIPFLAISWNKQAQRRTF